MSRAIFLRGSIRGHLWRLSYPGAIYLFATLGFVLADTYFIAQLGPAPLAAIGFAFPILELATGIGLGLGIASSTLTGQALGGNKKNRIKHTVGSALLGNLCLSIILTLLGIATLKNIFPLLGATHTTMPYVMQFMHIWYWGLPLFMLTQTISFTLRVYGWVKTSALTNISGAGINLLLDPLFIFGLWGFPHMGIAGAALAGIIARAIIVVWGLHILWRRDTIAFPIHFALIIGYWKRLMHVAIPAGLTNMIPPVSVAFSTYLLSHISQSAVAGYGVASRIQWFIVIPMLCLSGALSPVVSQNHGAKQFARSQYALSQSLWFCLLWGALSCIVLALFARSITGLFTHDPTIAQVSRHFLYIVPVSFFGWGTVMMLASTLNAMAKPLYSTAISALRMLILFFPLATFLMWWLGANGVFVALSLSNILAALLGWLIVKRLFARCCTHG